MKIFLDARNPRFNGSWTYMAALLPKLVELYSDHEYIVLYDKVHRPLGLKGVDERVTQTLSPAAWIAWNQTLLPRLLKDEKIDIYHGLKQMSAFNGPTRKVYTVHGATHFVYPQLHPWHSVLYWKQLTKLAARTAHQVIAVSASDKRNLCYWGGIPEERITVIPLAATRKFRRIDDDRRKERLRVQFGLDYPFLLFVGRVDPFKNIVGMVKAFAESIKRHDTGHRLVIAGDKKGYQSSNVYKCVEDLGLSSRVVFTGHVMEDLEILYNLADAFILPSLYEAFGLVLVEAMACGLPVISSRVAGCVDVVGDAGILVDPLDIHELSEAISRVLSSEDLRRSLSEASVARAACFSWERCARETFALYQKVYREA